jgi:cell division protease FtsH
VALLRHPVDAMFALWTQLRLNALGDEDVDDFEAARDKVFLGPARRSRVINEEDRKRTAYHEAGHALVAQLLPKADAVHKVTIIPRGRAMGVTWYLPEERSGLTREDFRSRIASAMGGRVAEEIIFNELSTGASNDLKQASKMARDMVCRYGMSERLGPVSWEDDNDEVFLGRDFGRRSHFSESTSVAIDDEVRSLVETGQRWAKEILIANVHILHKLAQLLLEKETVDSEEFLRVVHGLNPILPESIGAVA